MSGLVSGLQNRVRRFESARNLEVAKMPDTAMCPAFVFIDTQVISCFFICMTNCVDVDRWSFFACKSSYCRP